MQSAPMKRIGPFHLDRIIGEGGQSVVWHATDVRTNHAIALKVLRAGVTTPNDLARLRREAQVISAVSDPGLPKCHELFEDETTGTIALAMEFIDGTPLSRVTGPLAPSEVVTFARELVRVLGIIHATGIVHRDLKPANIILRTGWGSFQPGAVVLVDFGIAKGSESHATRHTATGAAIGTIAFMAPELLLGNVGGAPSPTWDIYSVGIILWALLTGAHPSGLPFTAPLSQFVMVHLQRPVPSLDPPTHARIEALAPGLVGIVNRCVSPDPNQRFQTASELAQALSQILVSPPEYSAAHPATTITSAAGEYTGLALSDFTTQPANFAPGPYGPDYTRLPTSMQASGLGTAAISSTGVVLPVATKKARNRWLVPLAIVGAGLVMLALAVVIMSVVGVGLVAGALGSRGGKVADCNKAITALNRNGETIKTATDEFTGSKKTSVDVDRFSTTIGKAGDEVRDLDIKDQTLRRATNDYHDMLDKLAGAAKDVNSTNRAVQAKALADLNSIDRTEAQIIGRINSYCGAH